MEHDAGELLAAGRAALEDGRWSAAKVAFEEAADLEPGPEALLGLAEAVWWLGDITTSVRLRERAYAELRRTRMDAAEAARVALRLSLTYRANLGNRAAAAGWLERAARLVDDAGDEPLSGWIALARAGEAVDPVDAERLARVALECAQCFQDPDLELCAISQIGSSLVAMGSVRDGLARLDEAMAGSLAGECASLNTVVFTSCQMMVSCNRAGEFERAGEWVRAADGFSERYGCPFLHSVCRTVFGGMLFWNGRWAEAEQELLAALRTSTPAQRAVRGEVLARLAELRLAQGRIEEAERLVQGFEDQLGGAVVGASILLARGRPAHAAAVLRRLVADIADRSLDLAAPLELLVEAELAEGAIEAATDRARRLDGLGISLGCDVVLARGARACGRVLLTLGDPAAARTRLDQALRAFGRLDMPLEAARARLLISETLAGEEPEAAIAEGHAALTAFEELGAAADANAAAAAIRALGAPATRAGGRGAHAVGRLTRREVEVLRLMGEGLSNREIAGRLVVSRKTAEHHVAHVLGKLGLRSRAEAAAFAVRELEHRSAVE